MATECTRAAAYVLVFDTEDRILLTRFEIEGHPKSGAWTLPGGGMEPGEQAHETAKREFREETGLDVQIGRLLGSQSEWFETTDIRKHSHALRLIFEAQSCEGTLKTDFSDDDTTTAAAWFNPEEIPNLFRVEVIDFALTLVSEANFGAS